jgi:uncharacterized protein (TIGR02391 family)
MGVPLDVTPNAPPGEQNAPEWTPLRTLGRDGSGSGSGSDFGVGLGVVFGFGSPIGFGWGERNSFALRGERRAPLQTGLCSTASIACSSAGSTPSFQRCLMLICRITSAHWASSSSSGSHSSAVRIRSNLTPRRHASVATLSLLPVDRAWMRGRLDAYRQASDQYRASIAPGTGLGDPQLQREMHRLEGTAKKIMRSIDPELADFNPDLIGGQHEAIKRATIAVGLLDDGDDLERALTPDAPTMPADQLHPWVWDAARTFWQAGQYQEAVNVASRAVVAHTQQKTGRTDLADDDLMREVFSLNAPTPQNPRLRFRGDRQKPTWVSRQRGALGFATGCFAGIRNVTMHEHALELPEQTALEYLASFSVLARWIDECETEYPNQ